MIVDYTFGRYPNSLVACSCSKRCLSCSTIALLMDSCLSSSFLSNTSSSYKIQLIIITQISIINITLINPFLYIHTVSHSYTHSFPYLQSLILLSTFFNQFLYCSAMLQLLHSSLLCIHELNAIIFGKLSHQLAPVFFFFC